MGLSSTQTGNATLLDLHKAFHNLSWNYLFLVLEFVGFGPPSYKFNELCITPQRHKFDLKYINPTQQFFKEGRQDCSCHNYYSPSQWNHWSLPYTLIPMLRAFTIDPMNINVLFFAHNVPNHCSYNSPLFSPVGSSLFSSKHQM